MDPFAEFKAAQRKGWAFFAPLEAINTIPAAKLVAFAQVKTGQKLLDVGTGTGVVAITAARWGDPNVVRDRLGAGVRDLFFDRGTMITPALSPAHHRMQLERSAGPVKRFVESAEPDKLAQFRREYEALVEQYFDGNCVRQDFLMSRAVKA